MLCMDEVLEDFEQLGQPTVTKDNWQQLQQHGQLALTKRQ